jgi:hypothetical protein
MGLQQMNFLEAMEMGQSENGQDGAFAFFGRVY